MALLVWMAIGLVVGAVVRFLIPPSPTSGPTLFILLGIAGAMLAGVLGRALRLYEPVGATSFASAALGAVALILLYRLILNSRIRS